MTEQKQAKTTPDHDGVKVIRWEAGPLRQSMKEHLLSLDIKRFQNMDVIKYTWRGRMWIASRKRAFGCEINTVGGRMDSEFYVVLGVPQVLPGEIVDTTVRKALIDSGRIRMERSEEETFVIISKGTA